MTHRTYENWIFTDEELTSAQHAALNAHLRTCDTCYRLHQRRKSHEYLFRTVGMLAPVSGFSVRFYQRLMTRDIENMRTRNKAITLVALVGLMVWLGAVMYQFASWLRFLPSLLSDWTAQIIGQLAFWEITGEVLWGVLWEMPNVSLLPVAWSVFWLLGGAGLLWGVSVSRILSNRKLTA